MLGLYLASLVNGSTDEPLLGTMRINLRIGTLIVRQSKVEFEALPLTQIVSDSRDQHDDMASKMSSISKISAFKGLKNSGARSKIIRDITSRSCSTFLANSPEQKKSFSQLTTVTGLSRGGPLNASMALERGDRLQMSCNPITGE